MVLKMDLSVYANALGIKENLLSIVGEGANGIVLTDGSGVAFKFPKHELALPWLKQEIGIIGHISKSLSVRVPNYFATYLERPIGEAYCSFSLIPGVKLSKEIYKLHRHKIAKQLLSLLDEIHAIAPLETIGGNKMDFEALYHEIQKLLFPLVEDKVKRDIESRFMAHLQNPDLTSRNECVIHGDFGSANIICDPETGTITGIIDWAEVAIDDPALDYSSLTCAMGIPMCKEDLLVLRPSLATIFQRSSFIQYTFPLQEALHGVKTNDEEALRSGLCAINNPIKGN